MYRIAVIALAIVAMSFTANAHDSKDPGAPNPSPMASVSQQVGHTDISITYGRPGVKDREIWGKIVEYNGGDPRPWVAGANGTTKITFADDVKVNGNDLKAGDYGLHIIPSADEWIVIFSTDASRFSIMKYTADKDALRITVKPQKAEFQEWLAYEIEKTGMHSADINLHWENVKAGFQVETPDKRAKKDEHANH